jgi:hypothetical protein
MPYEQGHSPNRLSAFELVVGSFEDMESAFYDVKYPDILWRDVVPESSVDTSINPGATTASYRSRDKRGKGSFRAAHDQGVPTVGQTLDKVLVPIEVAGVSAIFDRDDARQIQFGYNENLLTELSDIMREACERHVEGTIFYGDDTVKGFEGWLDYSLVTVSNAPNGGGGNSEWSTKTPDEIIADINAAISSVWTGSKQIHLPDTVYLPGSQLALIATTARNTNTDLTILEFVKKNNIYTSLTGNDLTFKSIRYLEGSGVGGVDRMVVAETKRPENFKLPFPLPFDLLPPQEAGFSVNLFAEYKFGSFHLRYPKSMLYMDGI